MSDNDLIRRGDALRIMSDGDDIVGPDYPEWFINRYATINAIPPAQPTVSPDVAALVEALEWYISEDETNEGDEPMPDHGNRSWNEINSYWIEGKRKAEAALARVKGVM